MELAKTLILNNKSNQTFKAVINLKTTDNSNIKFFNFNVENKNFALGIKQQESVFKIPLKVQNNFCQFELPKNLNLNDKMFCAVVDVTNVFCPEIVLSGSVNSLQQNNKIENAFVQTKPENVSELYNDIDDEQLEKLIDKNLEEDLNSVYYDTCSNCKYREAFYEEGKNCSCLKKEEKNRDKPDDFLVGNLKSDNNLIDEKAAEKSPQNEELSNCDKMTDNNTESSFYAQIEPQITALFERYSSEDVLEKIISNSKWVKVTYNNNDDYYVLGLIYKEDNSSVDYISYGMPSNNSLVPPEDLKDFAQWLPTDFSKPNENGYWIVYQDALTGETIKIDLV